jgi:small subunit ribosomal protein S16
MVKIRLSRIGRNLDAAYRIVVTDSRRARDGHFIEQIGHYDPAGKLSDAVVDEEKAVSWLLKGAAPSDTIKAMLKEKGIYAKYLEAKNKKEAK